MPGRELLERFRPAASPGTVVRVGVPADAVEDADLRRVLDSVRPTVEAAERIRCQAHEAARAIQEAAEARSAALAAQARIDAVEARARAGAQVIGPGRCQAQALCDEAADRARQVRTDGAHRLPEVVARVVARVVADLSAEALPGGGDRR